MGHCGWSGLASSHEVSPLGRLNGAAALHSREGLTLLAWRFLPGNGVSETGAEAKLLPALVDQGLTLVNLGETASPDT